VRIIFVFLSPFLFLCWWKELTSNLVFFFFEFYFSGNIPKTNAVRNQTVQPRYKQKANPQVKKNGWVDENCSFAPRTNPVKKDMESAQLYLEVPAFERLSRSRTSEDLSSLTAKSSSRPSSQKRPRSSSVGSLSSILR
jgi:hypothetical protein